MIALKNEFITDEKLNQIEVTVEGRTFYLNTSKDAQEVFGDVQDFLGGACKTQTDPEVVALIQTPKKRGPYKKRKHA